MSSKCYQPNSPHVIHEVIDGEAVLISMETGSYYSIDNVGATIWSYIESGLGVAQIIEAIISQYAGDRVQIENGVDQLISQLLEERLIVPAEMSQESHNLHSMIGNLRTKPQFEMPVLHKYTDMEDLLLLDPIHEVDESGWPAKAPN
jgi:hypothetical protein